MRKGKFLERTDVLGRVISRVTALFLAVQILAYSASGGTESVLRKDPPDVGIEMSGHSDFIDVLVVYTSFAKGRHGGTSGIETLIQNAVELTNTAFINSDISARLRLVHMQEVG